MGQSIFDNRFDISEISLLVSRGETIEMLAWIFNRSYYSKFGEVIYPTYRDMVETAPKHIEWILNNVPGFFSQDEKRMIKNELVRRMVDEPAEVLPKLRKDL